MAHIVRRYESLSAFADKVEPESETGATGVNSYGNAVNSSRDAASHFNGETTFEQAIEFARHGWSEEHETLEGMLAGLTVTVETMMATQWESLYSVEGGAVDVDRFLNGEPENMIQFVTTETTATNQVVKVLVSTGALGAVDSSLIRMRGLAVCCFVELISRSGKVVELWAESTATGQRRQIHTQLVRIKEAGSYLDLDQIMFALVHPSWHRRMMFSGREHEAAQVRKNMGAGGGYGSGYGSSKAPMMAEEVGASVVLDTIQPGDRNFGSVENAVKWIGAQLKALGLTKVEG